jgi:hypothetical protein
MSALKFTITRNVRDAAASFSVDTIDAWQHVDKGAEFAIDEDFGGEESNILRDGQKEGNVIDKHDVDTQDNITVVLHELLW